MLISAPLYADRRMHVKANTVSKAVPEPEQDAWDLASQPNHEIIESPRVAESSCDEAASALPRNDSV